MYQSSSPKQFGIVGGDLRQVSLANHLAQAGYPVYAFAFDDPLSFHHTVRLEKDLSALPEMDILILPLPVSSDLHTVNTPFSRKKLLLADCFDQIHPGTAILGGMVSPDIHKMAAARGFTVLDYLNREEMAVLNAVPTAEGAIEITMNELATTIWNSKCLITGYGRIAKVLARILQAMGAKVSIAARKEADLAWISVIGCTPLRISQLADAIPEQDIIYNTVPSMLFDQSLLSYVKPDCLVIDLASKPGGIDFDLAREMGIKTIWALSLPGKVAPITAGNIIKDTVINMLTERGEL